MKPKGRKVMNKLLGMNGLEIDIGATPMETRVYFNGEEIPVTGVDIRSSVGYQTEVTLRMVLPEGNIKLRGNLMTTEVIEEDTWDRK